MKPANSWLERKKASICVLTGIFALSLFTVLNSGEKINEIAGGAYVIKMRHYGINAEEIERSITVPLEDELYSIPGIMDIQSSSENSLSNVFISFRHGIKGHYEAVRDAAQKVYETLPPSAQRPEIISSNNSRVPVWSAAVFDTVNGHEPAALMLDKIVKPRLENLEDAGEVLVSGSGLKEIYITLDMEKLNALNLEPYAVISFLAMNDSVFPGGILTQAEREIIVSVDGRYDQLDTALIPAGEGRYIKLTEIAHISEQEREPDIYSRLNGRRTASIAVMGRDGADLRRLSSEIKKEFSNLSLPLEFTVLSDLGAEETIAFRSVLNAALSGAFMVALISYLLNRKNKLFLSAFFCALVIPLICLISAAVLSLSGFLLDRFLLAGISAGVGTAIDSVILCSEKLRKCSDYKTASLSLSGLKEPLISGGATTVAALVPLSAGSDIMRADGAGIIAYAISVVTVVSLVISMTFLPPLLLWRLSSKGTKRCENFSAAHTKNSRAVLIMKCLSRKLCRLLGRTVGFCFRYPLIIPAAGFIITVSAILLLSAKGADTGGYGSQESVYVQVEFDGGLMAEEVDRLLSVFSGQVLKISGVKNVETGARTGSGTLLVSFDPGQTQAHAVRAMIKQIDFPEGFVFFHENTVNDHYWEILICGDDDQMCRDLARNLAFLCADHPIVRERILNFKEGSKKITLIPDREIFAGSDINFSAAADRIRLGVYGPVAYKRIGSDGETDVRFRTAAVRTPGTTNAGGENIIRQSREEVLGLLVPTGNNEDASSFRIDSLMGIKEETEPSSIRRDNRRRTASITIATKSMDPRRVKQELAGIFGRIDLPPGYSIEFDPQAIKQSENLSSAVLSLVLAIIFCYIIIASVNESFSIPLLVLSAVPLSLSVPALCLFFSGGAYNSAVACAFIAVSGMTVNAAIFCVDGLRTRVQNGKTKSVMSIYLALRNKMPVLLATTGTTIAGAVPFLFLKEAANTLIRTLSLVGAFGVACSFICAITVIPSLLSISKISLKPLTHN